jgi:hypothetical protein
MTTSPTPSENPQDRNGHACRIDTDEQQAEQEALKDPIKQEQYRQEYLRLVIALVAVIARQERKDPASAHIMQLPFTQILTNCGSS